MYAFKRGIHFDFHTQPGIEDFLRDFDAHTFAKQVKDTGADYINFFCKCNNGFCYYPTEIGIRYPQMKGDLFGDVLRECHALGIKVTAYFNGGLDHENALLHRDWTIENADGQGIYGDRSANSFRQMCFNSPYRDYLLGLIQEVVTMYPDVDGVFVDSMHVGPACHGVECTQKALSLGLDPTKEEDLIKVSVMTHDEINKQIKEIVGDRNLRLNCVDDWEGRDLHTHCEVECLPGGWSCDYFPTDSAYVRNIYPNVVYMTGRFVGEWGDLGSLRTRQSVLHDVHDAIANCTGFMVGDHMDPIRGFLPPVADLIKTGFDECIKYDAYTNGAKVVADVAILSPKQCMTKAVMGATRLLGELHVGYNTVNEDMDLTPYQVLLLPDEITVDETLKAKLKAHLAAGKKILSSGISGLTPDLQGFALPEWTYRYDGKDPHKISFMAPRTDRIKDTDDMNFTVYCPGILFYADDKDVTADYVAPVFDFGWDGQRSVFYIPPKGKDGHASAAYNGHVYHIGFNLFEAYYTRAMTAHKDLFRHAMASVLSSPSFCSAGIPSYARLSVTKQNGRKMAHIRVTVPEPRGCVEVIEDPMYLPAGATVSIKGAYNKVYSATSGTVYKPEQKDGYTVVTLPQICDYEMTVFE